jgi:miniconductance mechanosensitive channel
MSLLYDFIKELLQNYGLVPKLAMYGAALSAFIMLVIFSLIIFFIVRSVMVKIIGRVVAHTKGIWDDVMFSHKVFHVMAHFVPAIIIYNSSGFAGNDLVWLPWLPMVIVIIAKIYILGVFVTAFNRFLNSFLDIYNTYPYAKDRPVKGYVQLLKVLIYFLGGITMIAILVGQNPVTIFAGLGAMAAVLLLVFRDVILGFVASIQLAANKMVKPGDWITVPKFDIDGTVEDINLTSVKIKNFDMTITTIPTYSLVSESMINWIGMKESGGRRIKRSISIDITSIRICDEALTAKLRKVAYLNNFINFDQSVHENLKDKEGKLSISNDLYRSNTNLSLFKEYLEGYFNSHPAIHANMTRIVRFLQSDEKGLPVEIIVFSKFQEAEAFERLQSEIFNHIFAVLPDFELRVYQTPSINLTHYPAVKERE